MTRHRDGFDVTVTLDASNTNPRCPDCDYLTRAVDAYRCACTRCGQIVHDEHRVARAFAADIGGTVE